MAAPTMIFLSHASVFLFVSGLKPSFFQVLTLYFALYILDPMFSKLERRCRLIGCVTHLHLGNVWMPWLQWIYNWNWDTVKKCNFGGENMCSVVTPVVLHSLISKLWASVSPSNEMWFVFLSPFFHSFLDLGIGFVSIFFPFQEMYVAHINLNNSCHFEISTF